MQIIRMVGMDAAEYAQKNAHRRIERPPLCSRCNAEGSLRALGFYCRSTTASSTGGVVLIQVRRFICLMCRRTTSILPSFAQPYRLICSVTIQRHFQKASSTLDTFRWRLLLRRYSRTFLNWFPKLSQLVGRVLGLPPPVKADDPWTFLAGVCREAELGVLTHQLVSCLKVTAFGKYLCHQ